MNGQVFVDETKHRAYLMVAAVLLPADVAPLRRADAGTGASRVATGAHEEGERTSQATDRRHDRA